jgi:hypothetical protein
VDDTVGAETAPTIPMAWHAADRPRKESKRPGRLIGRPPGGAKKERKSGSPSTPSMISKSKVWLQWFSDTNDVVAAFAEAPLGDDSGDVGDVGIESARIGTSVISRRL